jgi:PAS domain S-box-containing protein
MVNFDQNLLCGQIVGDAPDAVIFADREGVIRLWNRGAALMFGYAEAEAVGQSLDLIIPPRLRERHWEGWRRVMATGATRYGKELLAVPGLTKDGGAISLEFSIVLIKDARGQVQGAGAILRDVTARWEREKELRRRLAALEGAGRSEQ